MVANQWSWFLRSLPQPATGFACVFRVQEYLDKPKVHDPRTLLGTRDITLEDAARYLLAIKRQSIRGKKSPNAIKIQNVVCLDEKAGPILEDTTVFINTREVTMLYGAVEYDKSTFLRALLREVTLKSGSISLASLSGAYTGQQLWLLSATMLANMIGHESYDPVLYRKVVSICALDVDLQQLPDGNETMAGNAGTILSGGQKHRVSLARALYSEAVINVQDDPFSALGKKTLALVRSRLFAKGNAAAKGRPLDLIKVSLEEAVAYPEDFVRQKKAEAEDDGNSEELPAVNEVEDSEETILAKN